MFSPEIRDSKFETKSSIDQFTWAIQYNILIYQTMSMWALISSRDSIVFFFIIILDS